MTRKIILAQSPKHLFDVVPVFYKEARRHNIFDHFYIATDRFGSQEDISIDYPNFFGNDITFILLQKDRQFSSNIKEALKKIDDDIILISCEDYIMMEDNNKQEFDDAFDFVKNNNEVGFLRLTNNNKIPSISKKDNYFEMNLAYDYYVSLQPGIWKTDHLKKTLRDGDDAWKYEITASKIARNIAKAGGARSFFVEKDVFKLKNFLKNGKHYRHYFVDYAIKNNIPINRQRDVFVKDKEKKIKTIMTFNQYLEFVGKC